MLEININGQLVQVQHPTAHPPLGLREHHLLEIADILVRYNDDFMVRHWRAVLTGVTLTCEDEGTAPWLFVLRYSDEGQSFDIRGRTAEHSSFDLVRGEVLVAFGNSPWPA